jgi:hypothetical protein
MDEETRQWAFNVINDPEVYPDQVEQIIDYYEEPKKIIVVAIDDGNPPIVPLKQLAFWFKYSDDENQDLIGIEFKLLNPEEVEGGQSRPKQFAAHVPVNYMAELLDESTWAAIEAGECENCEPDPSLI